MSGLCRQGESDLKMEIYADGGIVKEAPENTIGAFVKCLDRGVKRFSFSVRMAQDGSLMVIKDDSVDRTTDGSGLVEELGFDTFRRLDAGRWFADNFRFERVPELPSVIDLLNKTGLGADLRLEACTQNPEFRDELVRRVVFQVERVEEGGFLRISSVDPDLLARTRQFLPDFPLALVVAGANDGWQQTVQDLRLDAVYVPETLIDQQMVDSAASLGASVYVIEEGDKITDSRLRDLADWGVLGIFTPDAFSYVGRA